MINGRRQFIFNDIITTRFVILFHFFLIFLVISTSLRLRQNSLQDSLLELVTLKSSEGRNENEISNAERNQSLLLPTENYILNNPVSSRSQFLITVNERLFPVEKSVK